MPPWCCLGACRSRQDVSRRRKEIPRRLRRKLPEASTPPLTANRQEHLRFLAWNSLGTSTLLRAKGLRIRSLLPAVAGLGLRMAGKVPTHGASIRRCKANLRMWGLAEAARPPYADGSHICVCAWEIQQIHTNSSYADQRAHLRMEPVEGRQGDLSGPSPTS